MRLKVAAFVLILGVALVLVATMRTANRADAAAGNCYTDAKGPAEPTVCS